MLVLLILVIVLYGLLHLSGVQTWLVHRIAHNLSERMDTKVTIKKVDFRFFDQLLLKGLMVEDRQQDTLLYAGTADVNLTDWFFFKDEITVNNIGLEDAVINMKRTDSVWNYQFLVDFFASPSGSKKNKKGVQVDVKEVHLKNVLFNKLDGWIGQDMTASLARLDLSIDKMDVDQKVINIKDIYLERPLFSQSDFEGNRPETDLKNILQKIPVVSAFKWNNSGWVARIGKLQIFDGAFVNDKFTERARYDDRFDGQHVSFSGINGSMSDVVFLHDTLQGDINLKAKERSGLDIKKLESHLRFTPELMEFSKLTLETNRSKLGDYYAMRYSSFNTDMSSFIHNVNLDANFKESVLSSDDLSIFAPALANLKRVFYIEGTGRGTIDNFTVRGMKIRTGNSFIDGNLSMRGLPDINATFIDLQANQFRTTYRELVDAIPALRSVTQPALSKLGSINYSGNYTGFINDFVAYGDISTSLGNLTADLNMKITANNRAAYSGKIKTAGFNLGQFINDRNLGIVALNGQISGQNFAVNDLSARFRGQIQRLDYAGYAYRNIEIDGNFKNKIFSGTASINDPNVKISKLEGEISFAGKELAFNADANLEKINFKQLGFTNQNVTLAGIFSLNFTGNTIDNFLGTARVYDATLQHDSTRLSFDSLALKSYIFEGKKSLTLQSNELDAALYGDFSVMELPDAFKLFLNRYYPTYIKPAVRNVSNQDFVFSLKTNNVDQYIKLLDPRLDGFNNSTISGSLNLSQSALRVNADVPSFSYAGKTFSNIILKANGNRDTLFSDISVGDIALNDSLHFPETQLKVASSNSVSQINLITSASKTLNYAELNASIESLDDGVRIHFFPSEFILNNKRWLLEKDGELALQKNFIDASEVKFVNGDQEIVVATEFADVTDEIHLVASLRNVIIEDILPFWVTKPAMRGKLTGRAQLRDYFGKQNIEFQGVVDSFSLEDKYVGKVQIRNGKVNTTTGEIEYHLFANERNNDFAIDGTYNFKDSTGTSLNTRINARRLNIGILEPFMNTVFSRLDGYATGDVVISDAGDGMTIIGDVLVDSGSLTVAYTQCKYLLRNQKIGFKKDLIDLGLIQMRDTLNNTGTVSGKIQHQFFKDFYFENVKVETGKMLLLNTTKRDNSQFYGNVIGSATMSIRGPITNLVMQIDGQPSILDSSHIYLPTGEVARENSQVDYIEFIQFGSEMDKAVASNKATNILVDMNITANPACKVDVILDEETGDVITGEGNGKLNIRVGTTEPLSIRGRYDLTAGQYTFNFQTLLKKPFILSRGSITWNGDPYLAIIDIDARYIAERVDISSITSSPNIRSREDVIILSKLTGNLTKPEIAFEFLLPETSEWRRDYFVMRKLADFQNDKNEMNKQVASLLLINTFLTSDQAFISGGNTYNLAATSIGGVLSDFLTKVLNRELERATNGAISTYVDINPSVDLQSTARQLQANVRAGFKILFSDKVNLLVGGNLDYNNPYLASSSNLTPDINIEWLLNRDGTIKVVGFNRTSIDLTSSQRNRSGLKLSYSKEFNRLGDIFRKKQRPGTTDTIPGSQP